MDIDQSRVEETIYAAIDDFNEQWPDGPQIDKAPHAPLFGQDGPLDSLSLVHFVVTVEEAINDTFAANITLASEKAMAEERSPFRTVGAFVDFAVDLLKANGNE